MSSSKKLRNPIVRDVLGIGLIKFFAIPASLGVSIILARNLGPSDYGVYAFVLSLTSITALALTGGLMQLLTREVSFALHEDARSLIKGAIRSATVWGLSSSLFAISCVWGVLFHVLPDIDHSLSVALLLGFLALPLIGTTTVCIGTLRGYGFGARSQYPSLIIAPITQLAALAILLAFDLLSLQTAILTFLVANAFVTAVGLYFMYVTISCSLRDVSTQYRLASWAKSSVAFTGIALLTYLHTQVGVLLLGFTSSIPNVAGFQIADRGAQLVILATAIIELVLAPHVARAHKDQAQVRLERLFSISRLFGGAVTLVLALPLIFVGSPIVNLIFGRDYVELAVQPLSIISAALVVRSLLGPTTTFLSMTGNERSTLFALVLALLVNVVLTLILAPRLGAVGAAWASAAGIICLSGLLALQTHRNLGIQIFRL